MKNDPVLDSLMKNPRVRNLGLKEELVSSIIESYSELALENLLNNGYITLSNGMTIEIVQLTDRVHVLRGVSYSSNRKYKLKLTMDESLYNKISDYYEKLKEEII